ncbi:hypothetical protein CEP54_014760 [Fusarium duplospermum]|uniref:Uncharacterized protein n=1 Tax=Fusarium duplospermum TaxID=1325734 RepID=A0A428NU19_9HYPO|nr:hypothetical protein CEP54_014760 [Fusarium duplospermum]
MEPIAWQALQFSRNSSRTNLKHLSYLLYFTLVEVAGRKRVIKEAWGLQNAVDIGRGRRSPFLFVISDIIIQLSMHVRVRVKL